MVGVILAAGNGIRLSKSIGKEVCKALQIINDRYLIEYSLNNLIDLNVNEAIIVVGQQGELIKRAIGYNYKGVKVSYVHQTHQKGLINAFVQALNIIENNKDVILQLADEIFINFNTENVKSTFNKTICDFYCGITYESNQEKIKNNFSVDTDKKSFIKKCTEKPSIVTNNIKGTGFCIFRHSVLQMLKSIYDENTNMPNDLCDFINYLIAENKTGIAFCLAEKEFNINTLTDFEEVSDFLQ